MERSDSIEFKLDQLMNEFGKAQDREAEYKVIERISYLGKPVILPLLEAVGHKKISLKRAAEICGEIRDPLAVEFLIAALASDDPLEIQEVARALGQIKDISAIKPLMGVFRMATGWGDDENDDILMAIQAAEDALAAIGGPIAFEGLLEGLSDDNQNFRLSCINTLSYLKNGLAIPHLQRMLLYYDPKTRRAAVEALGKLGNNQLTPSLLPLLEDEDLLVRCSVLSVLGKFGGPELVDPVARAISDSETNVRRGAVITLARLAGYHMHYQELDSEVNSEGIERVKALYGKRIIGLLKNALGDSAEQVRRAAARCLEELEGETQEPGQTAKLYQVPNLN